MKLLIYGANGYSGALAAEEALRRGHRPTLAGRSIDKLTPIASRLNLPAKAFSLDDPAQVARAIEGFDVVYHAAGPFVFTSLPMIRGCLEAGVSYVDITGEIPVFESTYSQHEAALEKKVCLMSGVGFDVIPTDCLALYVKQHIEDAIDLEIAFAAIGAPSAGTAKSALELLPRGNMRRQNGVLVPLPMGAFSRTIRFSDKPRTVMAIPWGDLVTAYRSTGIPNITTYISQPPNIVKGTAMFGAALARAMAYEPLRRATQRFLERSVKGPEEAERAKGRSFIWARAANAKGQFKEAWLETIEGYRFTAIGGLLACEGIAANRSLIGALTPAQAFGPDFVLSVPDTRRYDRIP
jgi:short subunit dehydrogenase-like uncharacterized protein